jgi:acid phosphatase type 7
MKTIWKGFRAALLMAAVAVLVFAAGAKAQNEDHDSHSSNNTWLYAQTGKSPVLAVVGDIACQPVAVEPVGEANKEACYNPKAPYTSTSLWLSQEATANQIEMKKPDLVALVGDLQYQVGEYTDFENSFDLTYGGFKYIHRPSPGNHEFYDEHGQTGVAGYGYFAYYNGFLIDAYGNPIKTTLGEPCPLINATICNNPGNTTPVGQPIPRSDGQAGHFEQTGGVGPTVPSGGPVGVGDGWYSYNVGSWHLISLNIECGTAPGGCSNNGAWFASELAWLKKDLDANRSQCTAAYWHQPTFSATNGISTEGITAQAFWQLLYDHGADLVLNGHDHLYAHYRPLDAAGNYDPKKGIREFIVGTGGETLDVVGFGTTSDPSGNPKFNAQNLEAGSTGNYWGVMYLTLGEHGYKWDFESALQAPVAPAGSPANYSDTGSGTCHGDRD